AAIAEALGAIDPPVERAAKLRPEALVEALVERARVTERGLLLLVDQLEELLTLGEGESRSWTVELLAILGEQALPGVRVLETARRDLLDPLLGLGKLGKALVRGSLLIAPMSDATWEDVIDQALAAYGYSFEDKRLRAELLGQLEGTASAMPLVQFSLTELWHKRDRENKRITREGLTAIGGVAGALERHADATLARLEQQHPGAERAARDLLLSLTTPQGTRALRSIEDLERAGGPLAAVVLGALEEARLVSREHGGATLAHEALLAQWTQLRAWVAEARADRLLAEEVERDAEKRRLDDSVPLWKRRRLEAAEDVLRRKAVSLSASTIAFIQAGRRAERLTRLLTFGAAAALILLSSVGVGIYIRDIGVEKAQAESARAVAEQNFQDASERKKALEEAKAQNDDLLEKLADAKDKEAMFALQDEVKKARGASPPAAPALAPIPASARPIALAQAVSAPPVIAAPPAASPAVIKVQKTFKR
ncbi:MAG: hypothetical protein ABI193_22450, partial [Minicystis sp.]